MSADTWWPQWSLMLFQDGQDERAWDIITRADARFPVPISDVKVPFTHSAWRPFVSSRGCGGVRTADCIG